MLRNLSNERVSVSRMKKNQGYNRRYSCSEELGISGSKMVTNQTVWRIKISHKTIRPRLNNMHWGEPSFFPRLQLQKQPLGLEFRVLGVMRVFPPCSHCVPNYVPNCLQFVFWSQRPSIIHQTLDPSKTYFFSGLLLLLLLVGTPKTNLWPTSKQQTISNKQPLLDLHPFCHQFSSCTSFQLAQM